DYRVGDYWIYEARTATPNDNGPWQATPHGPERLFAPLASLAPGANGTDPLVLVSWLDDRHARLGEIGADDVAYDGAKAGTSATTVQEALDELFVRREDGCCYVDLDPHPDPANDDAAARIRYLIANKLQGRGVICLRPGVYYLKSQIVLTGLSLELRGCPNAVLVAAIDQAPLVVDTASSLVLSEIVLATAAGNPCPALVKVQGNGSFHARECGLFNLASVGPGAAVQTDDAVPSSTESNAPYRVELPNEPPLASGPLVQLDDCVILSGWALAARNLRGLRIRGTVAYCLDGVVHAEIVHNVDVFGSVLATRLAESHFDELRTKMPSELEAAVTALLESGSLELVLDRLVFYARELYDGNVRDCSFQGLLGFYVGLAFALELHGNHHDCIAAIYLDNALRSAVRNEHVLVQRATEDYSSRAIAIEQAARSLTIEGCIIRNLTPNADIIGIFIAGWNSDGLFQDVLISNNRVHATRTGIQIRDLSESTTGSQEDRIVVSDNYIQLAGRLGNYTSRGISIRSREGTSSNRIEILGNKIYTVDDSPKNFHGIDIRGSGAILSKNDIISSCAFDIVSRHAFGLYIQDSPRIKILDNTVDLHHGGGYGAYVLNSPNAKISHNTIHTEGHNISVDGDTIHYQPEAIGSFNCRGLLFLGNVLSNGGHGGGCSLEGGGPFVVRDNILQSQLLICGGWSQDENSGEWTFLPAKDGTVSSNHLGWLSVYELTGAWQVSGNHCSHDIHLNPFTVDLREAEFHAQIQGNSARGRLMIGSGTLSGTASYAPSSDTTVQVIGNHTDSLYITNYEKSLLLGNMANILYNIRTATGFGATPPIATSNADLANLSLEGT
ncbi:MAG TPA: right-handed parallel beta-helix repeat-containing protein, partial [Haliangium sp.]|nr:right-handed parallel beta-helix repeat-containing protein [Haliangium sp.]